MPRDADIDKLLDKYKAPPKSAEPAPAAPPVAPPSATAAAPATPPATNLDPLRAETPRNIVGKLPGSPGLDITQSGKEVRDVARGTLNIGGDARRLAHSIAPGLEQRLEDLVKQIPGAQSLVRKGREFARQPDEEPIGRTVGQVGPLMALGPEALGLRAAQGVYETTMFPKVTAQMMEIGAREQQALAAAGKGAKAANKVRKSFQAERDALAARAEKLKTGFERVGKGAGIVSGGTLGGALADPEHPKTGATIGALTAAAPLPLRSKLAQRIAGHAAPLAVGEIAHQHFGVPRMEAYGLGGLAAPIFWHRSPMGRSLHRVGSKIVDSAGELIGEYSTSIGYEAEKFNQEHPQFQLGGIPDSLAQMLRFLSETFNGQTNPQP